MKPDFLLDRIKFLEFLHQSETERERERERARGGKRVVGGADGDAP